MVRRTVLSWSTIFCALVSVSGCSLPTLTPTTAQPDTPASTKNTAPQPNPVAATAAVTSQPDLFTRATQKDEPTNCEHFSAAKISDITGTTFTTLDNPLSLLGITDPNGGLVIQQCTYRNRDFMVSTLVKTHPKPQPVSADEVKAGSGVDVDTDASITVEDVNIADGGFLLQVDLAGNTLTRADFALGVYTVTLSHVDFTGAGDKAAAQQTVQDLAAYVHASATQ